MKATMGLLSGRVQQRGTMALLAPLWVLTLSLAALPLICAAGGTLNHPTGTRGLIMVDKVGSRVLFFDPSTDRELSELSPSNEPDMHPHELALSPDGRTAYVTIYGAGVFGNNPHPGHTIAIIDLASRTLIGSIDIAPYRAPHGVQVDAAGKLYVACDLDHKVLIIDPTTRHIEAAIDVEGAGHWIALAPVVGKLYVSYHGSSPFIGVIDLKARRIVGKIPIRHGTIGIAVSPDGRTLVATEAVEPELHILSTATDHEIGQIRVLDVMGGGLLSGLFKVFYSPDGRYILTCQLTGQMNFFQASNLQVPQRVVHSAGTFLMGFAFAADGTTVLTSNQNQGTVSRIDLASGTILSTFPAGQGVESLAYY